MILVNNRPILVNSRPLIIYNSPAPPVPTDEVTIGTQTWKISNLDIDDEQGGIITVNGNVYYTQEAAIRVAATVNGWHLPSESEFNTLSSSIGGSSNGRKLASTSGWTSMQGTDDYGFNALPLGQYTGKYSQTQGVGESAVFWTSTVVDRSADFGLTYLVKKGFIVYYTYNEETDSVTGFACGSADIEYHIDLGEIETNGPIYSSVRLVKDAA